MPLFAHAAGLGKLTVSSQLGQPLNAEIELVSLQLGEEETISARIAPAEAFNQAGIELSPALIGVRFTVERRQGRAPVLRVSSSQPVNEPFLEMLVEVQWATGRLVREYSFLLDPPEYRSPKPAAAAPAPSRPAVATPAPAAPRIEEKPIAAAPTPAASAAPAKAAGSYEVKKGDTLAKIAQQNAHPGVTLQQMLIALYRANEDAFIGGNINRLRSGRILNIPDRDAAAAVDSADAARLVGAQARDFAEYQSKAGAEVARAPAAEKPAARTATGKIAAKPEAAPPAEPKDQLKLSKADPKKGAAPAAKAARGDDAVARERALKEAQSRVQDLEKNLSDMQKLLELKNQQLAELEKKSGAAKPAAVPAKPEPTKPEAKDAPKAPAKDAPKVEVAKAEPPKAAPPKAEPAKPEPAKPEPAKAEPPKPEAVKPEPPKPEAAKPEAAKPAPDAPKSDAAKADPAKEAPKPAADAAKPKPKPAPPPPPPPPPSMVDQFLDNPLALGGLGGVAALLAGYGAWAWRRKKASQSSKFQDSVLGGGAAGGSASVLNAGAAEADGASVSSEVSVSDASVGRAEPDDVDPIAEADVYMAYGRDTQAEEILKEALAKDAGRVPVIGKLLEIYANRRDAKAFEASALKLKQVTGGEGADWDKAAALGRSFDPGNGLYGGSGGEAAPVAAAAAAPTLDFDIGGGGGGDAASAATDISLDLGGGDAPAESASIDFDLGGGAPAAEQTDGGALNMDAPAASADSGGLDFDLGGDTSPAVQAVEAAPEPAPAADAGMDFDLNLDLGGDTPAAASAANELDLSSISLDLGGAPSDGGAGGGEKWQEVATKLDLAKAYEEMGDKDGARDLLNEVMKEGDAAQQAQAQQMLAALG